jgi:hypothetical protein
MLGGETAKGVIGGSSDTRPCPLSQPWCQPGEVSRCRGTIHLLASGLCLATIRIQQAGEGKRNRTGFFPLAPHWRVVAWIPYISKRTRQRAGSGLELVLATQPSSAALGARVWIQTQSPIRDASWAWMTQLHNEPQDNLAVTSSPTPVAGPSLKGNKALVFPLNPKWKLSWSASYRRSKCL